MARASWGLRESLRVAAAAAPGVLLAVLVSLLPKLTAAMVAAGGEVALAYWAWRLLAPLVGWGDEERLPVLAMGYAVGAAAGGAAFASPAAAAYALVMGHMWGMYGAMMFFRRSEG